MGGFRPWLGIYRASALAFALREIEHRVMNRRERR